MYCKKALAGGKIQCAPATNNTKVQRERGKGGKEV